MTTPRVDPVEIIEGSQSILLTCEHASERMPPGYAFPEGDSRLRGTHWAYDIGVAELTRELASWLDGNAVLSRFSRLLADPNRPEDSDTLFRDNAEGLPVLLNTNISAEERQRRLAELHRPYHAAVERAMVGQSFAFSIHSFTPLYEGEPRSIEVGVLFDADEEYAYKMHEVLVQAGLDARLNEPYSGKNGLMYCVDRHSRAHGIPALELEVRQDLLVQKEFRGRLVALLGSILNDW